MVKICGFNSPGNVRDAIKSNKKAVALDLSEMIGVSWTGGFSGCTALKSVTLPDCVTRCSRYAFGEGWPSFPVYYAGTTLGLGDIDRNENIVLRQAK